jgi:hypothetical protein
MPLDSHLFCDLREALARNIAFTFWMEKSDKRKYKGGTPDEVYQSICRTIETDGVSEHRIIEDIVRIKKESKTTLFPESSRPRELTLMTVLGSLVAMVFGDRNMMHDQK